MNEIIDFLRQLTLHNDKVWFNAHKQEYLNAKKKFENLVEELIDGVRVFDDSVGPLSVADCTWRIYRDTRFSKDKRPYKNYFGCYFAPQGKKGPYSGYYFQLGIDDANSSAVGMLAAGNYYTEPRVLKIFREDIDMDGGKALEDAMRQAKGYRLDTEQMLKRVPRGFSADEPYSHYFKYKNFCLVKHVDEAYITSVDFRDKLLGDMSLTKPFLHLLNQAIQYSIENED